MVTRSSNSEPLRALVVDDEPAIRMALEIAMREEGWEVTTAENGHEALISFGTRHPDVVVADKNLPGMSGIQLLGEIRKQSETTAFVLITGYGNLDSAREAIHLDVDGYLEKPFRDIFGMLAIVGGYVERRRTRFESRAARAHFHRAANSNTRAPERKPPLLKLALADGDSHDRVLSALAYPLTNDALRLSKPGEESQVSVAVCDAGTVREVSRALPQAFIVAIARSSDLSGLLSLIDDGANVVVEPQDSPDKVRLSIERALRLAAQLSPDGKL